MMEYTCSTCGTTWCEFDKLSHARSRAEDREGACQECGNWYLNAAELAKQTAAHKAAKLSAGKSDKTT